MIDDEVAEAMDVARIRYRASTEEVETSSRLRGPKQSSTYD